MKTKLATLMALSVLLAGCLRAPAGVSEVTSIPTVSAMATATIPPGTLTARARLTNIAEASSTTAFRLTVAAKTPSSTPRPTQSPTTTPTTTPTINPTALFAWSQYENPELGLAFEFPAYFDMPPFSDYTCGPTILAQSWNEFFLEVGERLWITGKPYNASTTNLADYVQAQLDGYKTDTEVQITNTDWGYVSTERAFTIEYRFGALNRYGVETYFAHRGIMYSAVFSAGATCSTSAQERGMKAIDEFEAYWHILETWRFLD